MLRLASIRPAGLHRLAAALTIGVMGAGIVGVAAAADGPQPIAPPEHRQEGHFGAAMTVVPDVDRDGADDFAISSPQDVFMDGRHPQSYSDGRVTIYSGLTGEPIRTIERPLANDFFGLSIAGVPDQDGDRRPELMLSAEPSRPPYVPSAFYVFSTGSARLLWTMRPAEQNGWPFTDEQQGPDLDGDGRPDLIVLLGGPFLDDGAPRAEVVRAISSVTGRMLRQWTIPPTEPVHADGLSIAVLPDTDTDGDSEPGLAIGFPDEPSGLDDNVGTVYLFRP